MLVVTAQAVAGFGAFASDSVTVSTATLDTPTGTAAAVDTCTPATSVTVQVTWTASSDPTSGYAIFRSAGGGPSTQIGTVVGSSTTSFLDTTAAFATDYVYTVESARGSWTSGASADAALTTPTSACV